MKKSLLLLALCATRVLAGPFGLEMGMSLVQLGIAVPVKSDGLYVLATVPKPHPLFETYVARVAPKGGLCWIQATTPKIETNSFGTELKRAFEELEGKIESVYGKHLQIDLLRTGSIWDEPNDWMMGMRQKERYLAAVWEASKGSTMPPGLAQVGLVVQAGASGWGKIYLEYSFDNEEACKAELAAEVDDAF